MTSYSTLDHEIGDAYRDLELRIAPDFVEDLMNQLAPLGGMIQWSN